MRGNSRSREAASGPAKGPVVVVQKSVLLLEAEPRHVLGVGLHDLGALVAVVELVGRAIGAPALGQDNDVGGAAEGIRVDGAGAQVDVRVLAGRLVGRGAVEVPDGELLGRVLLLLLGQRLSREPSQPKLHNHGSGIRHDVSREAWAVPQCRHQAATSPGEGRVEQVDWLAGSGRVGPVAAPASPAGAPPCDVAECAAKASCGWAPESRTPVAATGKPPPRQWPTVTEQLGEGGPSLAVAVDVRIAQRQGRAGVDRDQIREMRLTLDLDRTSPSASIQTYSAMMLPFWSSFMYLLTCRTAGQHPIRFRRGFAWGFVRSPSWRRGLHA